jgi:hypothetical protein
MLEMIVYGVISFTEEVGIVIEIKKNNHDGKQHNSREQRREGQTSTKAESLER